MVSSGGAEATRNQFPYQAALFIYSRDGQSLCGGSILSANWVLTAAHCFVSFESADVIAGVHNIFEDDPGYELEVFPADVANHPSYNQVTHLNDVSLVRTSRRPIVFSVAIQPITLIPRSMASTDLTNTMGRIAGW
jgi:secreted trypsin-like serine protease